MEEIHTGTSVVCGMSVSTDPHAFRSWARMQPRTTLNGGSSFDWNVGKNSNTFGENTISAAETLLSLHLD
jgi:hypothetical protein